MSGSNEMGPNIVWHLMVLLPEAPGSMVTYLILVTPGCDFWRSGCMPSQITRRIYSRLASGEILPACCHRDGERTDADWARI
jgi:hypothetical protein